MKLSVSVFLPLLAAGQVQADYAQNAEVAFKTLQDKWNDLWWQSGNIVGTLARFGVQDSHFAPTAKSVLANTYAKSANRNGYKGWKNDYYDDMGWWAMAWIAAYDLTKEDKYLETSRDIFEDMTGGWNTPCGGIWWNKEHSATVAIANELFLAVAASLATRVPDKDKSHYGDWAQKEWDWFWASGLINNDGLINDGLNTTTCQNNGHTTWTYNQGVVLIGLSELARFKHDSGYTQHAYDIIDAVTTRLSPDGILSEPVGGTLDIQDALFKGVFVRGLAVVHKNQPQQKFADYLKRNADSAWSKAREPDGIIRERWQGGDNNSNTGSHAAGIDVLVAAAQAG